MDLAAAALALDMASAFLAALVTGFFLRSHRLLPRESLGVLAGAFTLYAVGYASALLGRTTFLDIDAQESLNILCKSGGGLLILVAYVMRWRQTPARTMTVTAIVLGVAVFLTVAYYAFARDASFPLQVFPYFRLADAFVLLAAASLSTIGVKATRLSDLRIPFAYTSLALSRYSTALALFDGVSGPSIGAYAWRLTGLLLLAATAVARWPRAPP